MLTALQCFHAALRCWNTSYVTIAQLLEHWTSFLVEVLGGPGAAVASFGNVSPSTSTGISPGTLSMGTQVLCSTEYRMVPSSTEGSGWWWGLWLITGVLLSFHVCHVFDIR